MKNTHTTNQPFQHNQESGFGILLVNVGSPTQATTPSVRRYLREFLSDPRMVEIPRLLWLPILYGFILPLRAKKSARLYQKIWLHEHNASPLTYYSEEIAQALQFAIQRYCPGRVVVALGMRYGTPSIADALEYLRTEGCRRLLILPLFPQYAAATTASAFDAVTHVLRQWRWVPELRFINQYADFSLYIQAIAESISQYRQTHGAAEQLLFSFHGIPKRSFMAGDPYHCHCQKTARLVAETLALHKSEWEIVFQSRFGRAEWLKPYCTETLIHLAKKGVKTVDVVCPGFAVDCLETLEEMAIQNKKIFQDAGGETLRYIPALNHSTTHIAMLLQLIQTHTLGWPEWNTNRDISKTLAEQTRQRATTQGASF